MGHAPARHRGRRRRSVLRRRLSAADSARAGQRGPRPAGAGGRGGGRLGDDPDGGPGRVAQRRDGGGGALLRGRTPKGTVIDSDLLPDAVRQLDADRRLQAVNAAASAFTGYAADEMVGQRIDDLLDPRRIDGQPVWANGWHRSTRLRSVVRIPEQRVRLTIAGGREVTAMVTGRYDRDEDGRLRGAVLVLRDGARRRSPAEGIEVISTVSHELRSPLTSVKGYTSLLLNRWERLGDEQKRMMLEQVHHDADRVTRLVTELLDISRLESGRLVLRRQLVDVANLVAVVTDKVRMTEP